MSHIFVCVLPPPGNHEFFAPLCLCVCVWHCVFLPLSLEQDLPIIAAVTDSRLVIWSRLFDGRWHRDVVGASFTFVIEVFSIAKRYVKPWLEHTF